MDLYNLLSKYRELDVEDTIYAERPFTSSSRAIVARGLDSGLTPPWILESGLDYFLEIYETHEVVEGWQSNTDHPITTAELVRVLIFYAENDAWPDPPSI